MAIIKDKRYLEGINDITDKTLSLIHEINNTEKEYLQISTEFLARLTAGYMFLYNQVMEDGMMPSPKTLQQFTNIIH